MLHKAGTADLQKSEQHEILKKVVWLVAQSKGTPSNWKPTTRVGSGHRRGVPHPMFDNMCVWRNTERKSKDGRRTTCNATRWMHGWRRTCYFGLPGPSRVGVNACRTTKKHPGNSRMYGHREGGRTMREQRSALNAAEAEIVQLGT